MVFDLATTPGDGSRYGIIDRELLVTPSSRLWQQTALLDLAETI